MMRDGMKELLVVQYLDQITKIPVFLQTKFPNCRLNFLKYLHSRLHHGHLLLRFWCALDGTGQSWTRSQEIWPRVLSAAYLLCDLEPATELLWLPLFPSVNKEYTTTHFLRKLQGCHKLWEQLAQGISGPHQERCAYRLNLYVYFSLQKSALRWCLQGRKSHVCQQGKSIILSPSLNCVFELAF